MFDKLICIFKEHDFEIADDGKSFLVCKRCGERGSAFHYQEVSAKLVQERLNKEK